MTIDIFIQPFSKILATPLFLARVNTQQKLNTARRVNRRNILTFGPHNSELIILYIKLCERWIPLFSANKSINKET